jgi:nucleoside-diphosphate-sugar epimerase
MLLDVSRLKALGWKPMYKSEEAVRQTTKRVLAKSDWH